MLFFHAFAEKTELLDYFVCFFVKMPLWISVQRPWSSGHTFAPFLGRRARVSAHLESVWRVGNLLRFFVRYELMVELVSKELNHFGVVADLFRQIGGHSSRIVLFCSFWRLFTIKMIKSAEVFPFSFWKIITTLFLLHKIQTPGINMQNGRQVI